jgi:hypothetical protein
LQAFHKANLDPTIGNRFVLGDNEKSVEVDLIARCSVPLDNHRGVVSLTAIIEAKNFGERLAFVGLKWAPPDQHSMRAMRIRFSGVPTCQVLSRALDRGSFVQFLLGGSEPIACALDPLNDGVICPSWSYVRDNSKTDYVEANREEAARDSFSKLLRVATWIERDHASFLNKCPGNPPLLRIELILPTIIIGTPHLYLYDSIKDALEPVPNLILQEHYEAQGEVHARYLDVICEADLPNFIERYRRTAAALKAACDAHIYELINIAREQQECTPIHDLPSSGRWADLLDSGAK